MTDRRRLQVRITLDSDMGPVFDWVAAIPERARARELVVLLRVGYAISSGSASRIALAAGDSSELHSKSLTAGRQGMTRTMTSTPNLELQGADATLEIFEAASVTGVPPP